MSNIRRTTVRYTEPMNHEAITGITNVRAFARTEGGLNMSKDTNANAPKESDAIVAIRARETARPEEVANALGVSGKLVRGFLRMTFPRPIEAKGTTWVLTHDQTNHTVDHFLARRSPVTPDANANA
jgi:DNA-binding transcriptional regulator YiaG